MLAIAPTDNNWFNFLRTRTTPSIVNFWTPTQWNVRKLKDGDHLLFLLKAPHRKLAGYGTFKYYENMEATEAWNRYGIGNGCDSLNELVQRATGYARIRSTNPNSYENSNPEIGCIVLEDPIFFDEEDYFKPEAVGLSFAPQVVKMKYFDVTLDEIIGDSMDPKTNTSFHLLDIEAISKKKVSVKERKGQSIFRKKVLSAYENTCAISGETCADILEAAHIQPYINERSNHIQNGICLRSDLHKLFDAGLLTIDTNFKVLISRFLSSEYYTTFDRQPIRQPHYPFERPSINSIKLHQKYVFRK